MIPKNSQLVLCRVNNHCTLSCPTTISTELVKFPPRSGKVSFRWTSLHPLSCVGLTSIFSGGCRRSPDAVMVDDRLYLRAERSSTGDGRFYHVHYTATDNAGASCSGVVTFAVPRTKKATAVDGGELYLSLAP